VTHCDNSHGLFVHFVRSKGHEGATTDGSTLEQLIWSLILYSFASVLMILHPEVEPFLHFYARNFSTHFLWLRL